MKDFLGNDLNIDDEVIFIYSNYSGGRKLMKGTVEKIEKGNVYIKGMNYGVYDQDPSNMDRSYLKQVKVKSNSIYKI